MGLAVINASPVKIANMPLMSKKPRNFIPSPCNRQDCPTCWLMLNHWKTLLATFSAWRLSKYYSTLSEHVNINKMGILIYFFRGKRREASKIGIRGLF
jgi:hypothetical protein